MAAYNCQEEEPCSERAKRKTQNGMLNVFQDAGVDDEEELHEFIGEFVIIAVKK